jgi:uncharacterized protein
LATQTLPRAAFCRFSHPILLPLLVSFSLFHFIPAYGQDSAYVAEHYCKTEVRIPMRDGVRLFTSIYRPVDTLEAYPVILTRTPYSVRPYGESNLKTSLGPSLLEAKEGFIFVYQDVRGRHMSEGEFVDIRPHKPLKRDRKTTDESSDTYDTVEWLIKNLPHNNGKVGITGISYPGFYSTMGLIDAHPAMVAGSPQAPIADWFIGDDDHHNGALCLAESFSFFVNFGQVRPEPLISYPTRFRFPSQDVYRFFLGMGPLSNAEKLYMRDSIPYWKDLMQHETYDDFWKARNVLPHLRSIRPAVMVVGGWFDKEDLYGALNTYKEIERNNPKAFNILVMGPWSHGQWNRDTGDRVGDISFGSETGEWFRQNVQFPFFSYFLKGKGTRKFPEATVFETGANTWRQLDSWPPKNLSTTSWYLGAGGKLATKPQAYSGLMYSAYISDPDRPVPHTADIGPYVRPTYMTEDQRFASMRPDVLVFETEPLKDDVTIAGPITASLFVSTTGTDADWVVKIIDVFPDDTVSVSKTTRPLGGYQMLVRGDVMRGKFRKSYSKPVPFAPGQVTRIEFTLQDVFHRFKSRHRIMVQVQSSWFPLFDRNPQTFVNIRSARADDFKKAEHRVYHSAVYPSKITVGVWKTPK